MLPAQVLKHRRRVQREPALAFRSGPRPQVTAVDIGIGVGAHAVPVLLVRSGRVIALRLTSDGANILVNELDGCPDDKRKDLPDGQSIGADTKAILFSDFGQSLRFFVVVNAGPA